MIIKQSNEHVMIKNKIRIVLLLKCITHFIDFFTGRNDLFVLFLYKTDHFFLQFKSFYVFWLPYHYNNLIIANME